MLQQLAHTQDDGDDQTITIIDPSFDYSVSNHELGIMLEQLIEDGATHIVESANGNGVHTVITIVSTLRA